MRALALAAALWSAGGAAWADMGAILPPSDAWVTISTEELRARYARVTVVMVTAPKEVLLARLAASGEPSIAESAQWAVSRIQAKDVSSDFRF